MIRMLLLIARLKKDTNDDAKAEEAAFQAAEAENVKDSTAATSSAKDGNAPLPKKESCLRTKMLVLPKQPFVSHCKGN